MAELKTKKNDASVQAFIDKQADESRKKDCNTLIEMMRKASKAEPKMWGPGIIGFGDRHLVYDSGRELDWFHIGFSPRKDAISVYGLGIENEKLKNLGKYKTGKGCLYIKKLADVDGKVLQQMMNDAVKAKK